MLHTTTGSFLLPSVVQFKKNTYSFVIYHEEHHFLFAYDLESLACSLITLRDFLKTKNVVGYCEKAAGLFQRTVPAIQVSENVTVC